jgi:hypothetical protein
MIHGPLLTYRIAPSLNARLLFWTCIASLLTAALSLLLLTSAALRDDTAFIPKSRVLRRPSPYVNPGGLRAAMRRHNTTLSPIVNNVPTVFQSNVHDTSRRMQGDSSRSFHSPLGYVMPSDQHFLVSSKVSIYFHLHCIVP